MNSLKLVALGIAALIVGSGAIELSYGSDVSVKSAEKDGWEVTRSVPDGPIPLNGYLYREARKASTGPTYYIFAWHYVGVDGSGTLRMEKRDRADLRETEPRVQLVARRTDDKQGMWKVFLFATVDYTAELEIRDVGDSRVTVKWLNPPKQK